MSGRNILQKVGAAPDLKNKPEESDSEEENSDKNSLNMNMKQESGPFLMPQLWKDNINLDNLTNDFLESNVTGEVMNLDDFLKELQVNELAQQTEEIQRQMMSPPAPHQQHFQRQHQQQQQQQSDNRFQNNLRPANIDSLKDPSQTPPSRPSIMHQVGKPPDLGMNKFGPGDPGEGGLQLPPHVNLPYRDRDTGASSALSPQQHNLFNSHNKERVRNMDWQFYSFEVKQFSLNIETKFQNKSNFYCFLPLHDTSQQQLSPLILTLIIHTRLKLSRDEKTLEAILWQQF